MATLGSVIKSLFSGLLRGDDKRTKKDSGISSHIKSVKDSVVENSQRDPYIFQIGFDFGTSSSKIVIRDINKDKAWVFKHFEKDNLSSLLIPSVILFDGDTFTIHDTIHTLYPENGLYHLKVALEKVALNEINAEIFHEYKNIVGKDCKYSPSEITKMATIFFLSLWLKRVVADITIKYPDYGEMKEDQIRVNMAIPVADICDENVRKLFRSMLTIAWELKSESIIEDPVKIDDLNEYISILSDDGFAENELCQVYPEVSANIQAFIRSPASSPDPTTIYFFTDVGAGTVDQSVFTYAGQEERVLNYFAGNVFPHGSRSIERFACGENIDIQKMEYWRKIKESGSENKTITAAKNKVSNKVRSDSEKTLQDTRRCLPEGHGVSKQETLREKTKFIFSGGGYTPRPYKPCLYEFSVLDSFKKNVLKNNDPIVTSMPYPEDLQLPSKCKKYISRFYVAYGLSFLFDDLAAYSSPSENKMLIVSSGHKERCSCGGLNKNCIRCSGTGIIN